MSPTGRIIIVSNRLPLTVGRGDGGGLAVTRSVGGLATGLRPMHDARGGIWIGWPGDLTTLSVAERAEVDRQLSDMSAIPVSLETEESRSFYEDISNGVIWPVCHDRLDRLPLRISGWEVYETINQRFADAVAEQWTPADLVWVHDFQLFRVPALVRERIPEARIGFFLHIPFPNPEIFFALPTRAALVEGIMGADLVGFHTRRYHGHFRAALRRLFHLEMDADQTVAWQGRKVRLGVHPMGIDARDFEERASSREVSAEALALRSDHSRMLLASTASTTARGSFGGCSPWRHCSRRIPNGRARPADPGRGAVARGCARLSQVSPRRRGARRPHQRQVRDADAGRRFNYVYRAFRTCSWSALYRAADVMLVTPLRDGMNLVAKEFVARRAPTRTACWC